MDNSNIYTIKLNAAYLAKWIRYIFIAILAGTFFSFFEQLSQEYGEIAISNGFFLSGATINIVITYCLLKLAAVEKEFNKAAYFLFLHILVGVIVTFIPEKTISGIPDIIVILISIFQYCLILYGEHLECRSFNNLLTGINDKLAKNWKTYRFIHFVTYILLLLLTIVSTVYADNIEKLVYFIVSWMPIISMAIIFCYIYKLIILHKSAKLFKNLEMQ